MALCVTADSGKLRFASLHSYLGSGKVEPFYPDRTAGARIVLFSVSSFCEICPKMWIIVSLPRQTRKEKRNSRKKKRGRECNSEDPVNKFFRTTVWPPILSGVASDNIPATEQCACDRGGGGRLHHRPRPPQVSKLKNALMKIHPKI